MCLVALLLFGRVYMAQTGKDGVHSYPYELHTFPMPTVSRNTSQSEPLNRQALVVPTATVE